jgi:hypothetical protein
MSSDHKDIIREGILEALEISLEAQLRAIKRLRSPQQELFETNKGMSKIEMAYDILIRANEPLHINDIIQRIETVHQTHVDRESLASAITKKVKRGDRFIKTGKNTFGTKKR